MLAFSEDEMIAFFKRHGINVIDHTYTQEIPVYHNRFEDKIITTKCVMNPINGTVVPVSVAFEKVIYHTEKMRLLEGIEKLDVLNVLQNCKGQTINAVVNESK